MYDDPNLKFKINYNETKPGDEVYITGNTNELGNWDTNNLKNKLSTNKEKFPLWESEPIPFKEKKIKYKYVIKRNNGNVEWENKIGDRELDISDFKCCLYEINDGKFNKITEREVKLIEQNDKKYQEKKEKENDKLDQEEINIIEDQFKELDKKEKEEEINKLEEQFKDLEIKNHSKKLLNEPFKIGLQNIGATCYMNATLQCFCHIKKFVLFFKNNDKDFTNKKTLSFSFKTLIDNLYPEDYNSESNKYYSPEEFKQKISTLNPLFEGIAANDAKDLVNFIIMQLHDELNKVKGDKVQNNNFIDQRNPSLVLNNFVNNFTSKNQSIISDLFYAMNKTITRCSGCNATIYNYQTYFFLVFPLEEVRKFKYQNNNNFYNNYINNNIINNNYNNVTIFDCFEYDKKENYMTGENKMYCNYCKGYADNIITTYLETGPEILILLLNRGKGIEFEVKVNFYEKLDLSKYIGYKNTGFNYELIGVITHIGESGMGGHFIAYCRDFNTKQWLKFNDAIVTEVNDFKNEVINFANPYLLFYQKQ